MEYVQTISSVRSTCDAFAGELQNLPVSLVSKVNLLPELLSESRAASTTKGYYQSFLRWKKWAILNGIKNCDILPAKAFYVAIYLASLTQSSNTVSPVVQAFYSLKWIHSLIGSLCSPTDSSLVINVLEGAKRSLATPTNKKEPISVELLHKMISIQCYPQSTKKTSTEQGFTHTMMVHVRERSDLWEKVFACLYLQMMYIFQYTEH
ncbi:unnamed protein product [Mytilus edulis]|uniref:Uncharacterized protein n=1 Tax=Mytilus edulis TaxID=6550 RepID=A0A8S3S0W7_MYTED|nr:unnamed protein product [Mytilus edulis]